MLLFSIHTYLEFTLTLNVCILQITIRIIQVGFTALYIDKNKN